MSQDVLEWLTPTFDIKSGFVVYTCNKDTTFFHGSPVLAYYSATYPVGPGFSPKIVTTRFNIEKQRQEIAEDFLISGDTSLTLERYGNPTCAYYAIPKIADLYTVAKGALGKKAPVPENVNDLCKHKCVSVYKTNYDLIFLYMNHPYNLFTIMLYMQGYKEYIIKEPAYEIFKNKWKTTEGWDFSEDEDVSDQFVSDKISTFFGWVLAYDIHSRHAPVFKTDEPFELNPDFMQIFRRRSGKDIYDDYNTSDGTRLDYANDYLFLGLPVANRYSTRESDLPLADFFCIILDIMGAKMDGFGNNKIINQGYFETYKDVDRHHFEVIFCSVLKDLRRDYDDHRDWQHTGNGNRPNPIVKNFLYRLNKCKIVNFNTYSASNFKELSIWTLLVYENIIKGFIPSVWGSATALLAHYVDDYTISEGKYMSQGIGGNSIWDLKKFNQLTSNYPYFVLLSNKLLSSVLNSQSEIPLLKVAIYTYLSCRHDLHILVCDAFNGVYRTRIPVDKDKHIKFILNSISLYILLFFNKKEYAPQTYADIFYNLVLVTIASYIAKQEHKEFLNQNGINILHTTSTNTSLSLNISSKNYNYITNVSSTYVAQDQRTHINNKEYLVQDTIQSLSYFFYELILNQGPNIKEAVDSTWESMHPYKSYYTSKLNKFKTFIPAIDDSFKDVYAPYIESLSMIIASFGNNRRHKIVITDNFKESIILLENENLIYTRVEYVLNLLKPIVHTIFDEYSNKQYPGENSKVPRMNHNGLNHTRQMYFTAYILQNTNFIERNNLNNSEIFWLLLASFCVGIGRYNESKHVMNIKLDRSTWNKVFSGGETAVILHDHDLSISNLQVNSLCIFGSIVNVVKKIFDFNIIMNKSTKTNLINANTILHLSTIGPHNTKSKDYEDFFNLINIGHYLDHCRRTTAYSQLDSSRSPWVMEFLRKYNEGMDDIQIKEYYYNKMYQILELTGYVRDKSIPDIPYSETDDRRCSKYFTSVNENKMLEYINDFDSLYYDLRKTEAVEIQEILKTQKENIMIERQNRKVEKWNKMNDEIQGKYTPDQDRLKANIWAKIERKRQERIDEMETKRDSKIEEAVKVRKDFIKAIIEGKHVTYKFDKYAGEAVLRDDGELESELNDTRDKLMKVKFKMNEIYERPITTTTSTTLVEALEGILSRLNETKERLEQKIEELEPILDFEKRWAIELGKRPPNMKHIAMEMLGERIWKDENNRREGRREEKERIKRMEERKGRDWEEKKQAFWEEKDKEKAIIRREKEEAGKLILQQMRKEKEAKRNEIAKKEEEEKRRKRELFNYFDKKEDLITYMRQNPGELDKLKELADMRAWRETYQTGERELDSYQGLYSKALWAIHSDEVAAAKAESPEAKDKEWRRTRTWGQTLSQWIWPTTRLEEERKKQKEAIEKARKDQEEEDQREIDKHLEEQKRQQEATRQQEEQKRQQEEQKRQEEAKRQLIKKQDIERLGLGAKSFDVSRIGIHTELVVSMEKYLKDPHTFTENVNIITSTILLGYASLPERIHQLNNSAKIGFDAYSAALVSADYIAMLEIVKDAIAVSISAECDRIQLLFNDSTKMLNSTNSYTNYRKFSVAANTILTNTIKQAKNIQDRFEEERKFQEERRKYENEVREREMKEATRIRDRKDRAYQNYLNQMKDGESRIRQKDFTPELYRKFHVPEKG